MQNADSILLGGGSDFTSCKSTTSVSPGEVPTPAIYAMIGLPPARNGVPNRQGWSTVGGILFNRGMKKI